MEVPVINRLGGLDSDMASLHNPTLLPQIFASRSGFQTISQSLHLWQWSAVIIALLATFSGVINRIKLLLVVFRRQKRLLQEIVDDSDSDGDFSLDDSASSVSSWSEFEEDDADETESLSSRSWDLSDRDFLVRGSDYFLNDSETKRTLRFRHRSSFDTQDDGNNNNQFSWAELTGGKSVVKLWDNLSFQFNHRPSDEGISGNSSINLWDTRVGSQMPALIADWKSMTGKVSGVKFTGDRKVYISNEEARRITVGDVRNVKSPVENLTAADAETWFDADTVMS
ncbi:uncharacterized protein LOC111449528 [Cucurbita moschata]|uniref:Uncharacterized protein LOC111449528 n=1 Tax=Cucurbita moschata TaxID=3662 RepID=A0A6J1G080_CUCMO|nr:uncharacterized protein LOC111449528 [Cucurbita moschata]